MQILFSYLIKIPHYFQFLSWKDPAEILFFSVVVYCFSHWLNADKSKPLLIYFYGYCITLFGTNYFSFITLSSFLILYGPVILILLALIHEEMLQKNFVTLKKVTPAQQQNNSDWLERFIRCCLRSNNKSNSILCIIQQSDELEALILEPCTLQAPFDEQIFSLVLNSSSYEPKKMLWLSKTGILRAVNCSWKKTIDQLWQSEELNQKPEMVVSALAVTQKTDSLFVVCKPHSGTFDIVAQGKLVDNISASSALRIIRHYLNIDHQATMNNPGVNYEVSSNVTLRQAQGERREN